MRLASLEKAITIIGSKAAMARALKIAPSTLFNYSARAKRVPAERCLEIEKLTNGEVTCYQLRPDVFPRPNSSREEPESEPA